MKYLIIIAIFFLSFSSNSIPIPKGNKATFDVIRKNKVIGTIETIFTKKDELLIINTNVDIDVKIFFSNHIPQIKTSHRVVQRGDNQIIMAGIIFKIVAC